MLRTAAVTLMSLTFAAAAFAAEPEGEAEPQTCTVSVAVTEALVRDAGMFDYEGFAGEAAAPAFIMGGLSPLQASEDGESHGLSGSVMFVRHADGWRALFPKPGEAVVGVFAAPETGALILATQWQMEGPGQSWTLVRSDDGFATAACVEIAFPDTLNQPHWANETLALHDLDIRANRRGEVIGVAHTETRGELWFGYRTQNGGETWSAAIPMRVGRDARAGRFQRIGDTAPPEALLAQLQSYAAGR